MSNKRPLCIGLGFDVQVKVFCVRTRQTAQVAIFVSLRKTYVLGTLN